MGLALDVLADMAWNALLPEEEVQKERGVILREIDMTLDDPLNQLSQALFSTAFREHPYRHPIIGYREPFETVSREQLKAYYQARYTPSNIVLVVVGDVSGEALRNSVQRYYGNQPRQRLAPVYLPQEPAQLAQRRDQLYADIQVCHGGLAFKIPPLHHADAPLLDLLAAALGSGNSSILWQRLREERQLVHHIDVSCWNPGGMGLFWIAYLCDPDKQAAVEAAIHEELQRVAKTGIDAKYLTKSIRQLIVTEINSRKTFSALASRQALCEVVIGDLDYPSRYFQRIQNIDAAALIPVMQRYLVPHSLTSLSLNPRQAQPSIRQQRNHAHTIPDDFTLLSLDNGVRLLIQHDDRLPKTHLRLAHRGGPLYENREHRGATALMANLLLRDTAQRTAAEVAETIESLGGTFSQFCGNNAFGLTLEVLSQDFAAGLECLEEALLEPAFHKERFTLERQAQIAQIKEQEDEIFHYGATHLRQRFFGEHPFCIAAEGAVATLNQIDVPDVQAYFQRLVVAPNTVAVLAGSFDRDVDLPRLQTTLAKLPDSPFTIQKQPFTGPAEVGTHEVTLPREQAVVFQAYPDCGLTEEGFIAGEVLRELCSEMSGNLFQQVREKRSLAYFVGASRLASQAYGMFYFYAGTHPDTYPDVLEQINAEVVRIQNGQITEEELHRCQNRLKAGKRQSLQTAGYRAQEACLNALYGLPIDHWKTYDARLERVDRSALQSFAQRYFRTDQKVVLVVKRT